MQQWGIFFDDEPDDHSEQAAVEAGFWSRSEAEEVLFADYDEDMQECCHVAPVEEPEGPDDGDGGEDDEPCCGSWDCPCGACQDKREAWAAAQPPLAAGLPDAEWDDGEDQE